MKNAFVLQDIVLNQIRRERSIAYFSMIDGREVSGKIHGFDHETVIIDLADGNQMMLYKKNILSVLPPKPVLTDHTSL
ncbi:MAG: RNA chaperone Hfq [Clostridiales bacterium]|nr:RNA chaperone Hfq [Clostridiales bacterium]